MVNLNFLETKLNRYALYRNANTLNTFYVEQPKGKPEQNYKTWFTEIYNITQSK